MIVKLGPYKLDLILEKNLMKNEGLWGVFSSLTQAIKVDPTQSKESLRDTIIHEMIHGSSILRRLDLSEQQVTILATDLSQMLTRFWRWPKELKDERKKFRR